MAQEAQRSQSITPWTSSQDGVHTNNLLEVIGALDDERAARLSRYMSKGAELTAEEKAELEMMLCPWATHEGTSSPTAAAAGP